ncbi:hypothetical protein MBANPS3_012539 [Mucor bainieri]
MSSSIDNFTVPADANGIEHYFKTIPLSQWSFWDYGSHHPQKLFSTLKSQYIENLHNLNTINIEAVSRKVRQLRIELKTCRAAQWKQHLKDQQLQQRVLRADGGEKVTPRTLRRQKCWKVNGFSLSHAFHQFRNESIDLLNQGNTLSTLRRLSLNGIFLAQPAPPPPLLAPASPSPSSPSPPLPLPSPPLPPCHQEYGITDTAWQQALAESKDKYSTLPAVSVNVSPFMKIEAMARRDQARAITITEELIVRCYTSPGMKPLLKYAKIVKIILNKLHNKDVKKMKEDGSCIMMVNPIIMPFMSNDYEFSGNCIPLNGSKARRGCGRAPDLSLRLNNSCLMLDEAKSEVHRLDNPGDATDFIKLANMMKDELDVCKGESKVCYGILIQGLEMSIFSFDLSFFKLYRLTLLDTVKLPASTADLITLLPCFQALARLEALIHSLVSSVRSPSSSNLTASPPQQEGASDEITLTSFPSPRL